jgi:signal transduction histidine kinase
MALLIEKRRQRKANIELILSEQEFSTLVENSLDVICRLSRGYGLQKPGSESADESSELAVGISGMRQRLIQSGGRLEVETSNNGTTITAVVPAIEQQRSNQNSRP